MNHVKNYLTAIAFSLAGVAVHANAATERHDCDSGVCFQLAPLAEDGSSRTPQGHYLEDQQASAQA
ncbi:hypothetical protein HX882_21220 [Pseudomonas gingeri]|uniref:Uncharacterized protein n=1 Tax=Pseudomonas gingeri TaxID=117681 RepID=A0A7Y7XEI4_9PSED|nr:hypothetical protein [Pseudomonas gingeri]NWA28197.1 hypothetical protein [Pseudomonas gingeri]NWB98423.1 hypothetical protein [Pseudomonas gingeri]NWD77404.1 hypothetical protein [Pseudomonas gingeri]